MNIHAVRERTTLLIPVRGIRVLSGSERKLPCPPEPRALGEAVAALWTDLRADRLRENPQAKPYWIQPGIRSFKAFQRSAPMVDAYWEGETITIQPWDGRSERGFVPLAGETAVLPAGVPPEELGAAIWAALSARVERERG